MHAAAARRWWAATVPRPSDVTGPSTTAPAPAWESQWGGALRAQHSLCKSWLKRRVVRDCDLNAELCNRRHEWLFWRRHGRRQLLQGVQLHVLLDEGGSTHGVLVPQAWPLRHHIRRRARPHPSTHVRIRELRRACANALGATDREPRTRKHDELWDGEGARLLLLPLLLLTAGRAPSTATPGPALEASCAAWPAEATPTSSTARA